MSKQTVTFQFQTGVKRSIFFNARLVGSWNDQGRQSPEWSMHPMTEVRGEDGCPAFETQVLLDRADADKRFEWGVILDGPQGSNFWGVPTEVQDVNSVERRRSFHLRLDSPEQVERYYLTNLRRLGANRYFPEGQSDSVLKFAVWAPNAKQVEIVFGKSDNGYIGDDGRGIDASRPSVTLLREQDGIWSGVAPGKYADYLGAPYMIRLRNAQDATVYRSDIFSRSQIGKGHEVPGAAGWSQSPDKLDGTVSCSVVIDPDVVRRQFESAAPGALPDLVSAEEFWAHEFSITRPVPTRIDDLIIYELHVGSLGFDRPEAGNLGDAIAFLDHLVRLGVNAVELMPIAEFSGSVSWGYGLTHHLCIEASAGGRDKYRHFVRECHRRGIAVLQDVVYNHYDNNAARAEWQYDSTAPEQNIYYWYEGNASDYPSADGGYLDNGSSGYAPRYWEESVRQQFISAAVFLVEEMHVDGLRVDLTQALHRDNRLHANGNSVGAANVFGQKLLREWSRTLHMIRPTAMLVAEDHTGWDAVTKPPAQQGLGFDATWRASFYHNLIGDADSAGDAARLLKVAGTGFDGPLACDKFAGQLYDSQFKRVVFHESHDEAGNAGGSARTMTIAVNHASLFGDTRKWAEARSRICFGMSMLSAGTPMFFMGEEVGAQKPYTVNDFLSQREDIIGLRDSLGHFMFRYYQELITLCKRLPSIRSQNIDILHHSNDNRVIVFKRWSGDEQVIIATSLNNAPFASGYTIQKDALGIPAGNWKEIFNSDAAAYGGNNVGNMSGIISSSPGQINCVLPAAGFVVLVKQ